MRPTEAAGAGCQVVDAGEAPGAGVRQPHDVGGDPDAAPVEVAVVGGQASLGGESGQQDAGGYGDVALDADQRRAAAAELVRGSRDHHGIFADPHESR